MMELRQSTAVTVKIGPFLDSTDGDTEETALTINQSDIKISKNGGAFAAKNAAGGGTHDANGMYDVDLDATDTNTLGRLKLICHASGALFVWHDFMVITQEEYDAKYNTGTRSVGLVDDAITDAKIASDAITADKIATDAIDADALASDAVTEILAGVIDGSMTLQTALRRILAFASGNFTVDGTTVTYKRQDGSTTEMTFDLTGLQRTVS